MFELSLFNRVSGMKRDCGFLLCENDMWIYVESRYCCDFLMRVVSYPGALMLWSEEYIVMMSPMGS